MKRLARRHGDRLKKKIGRIQDFDIRILLGFTTEFVGDVFSAEAQNTIPSIAFSTSKGIKGLELLCCHCNNDSVFMVVRLDNKISVASIAGTIKTQFSKKLKQSFGDEIANMTGSSKIFQRGYVAYSYHPLALAKAEEALGKMKKPSYISKVLSHIQEVRQKKDEQ